MELLHKIQKELKAPKNQTNKFGGYNYRSCEDIVEAVKHHLTDGATLVLNDEIVFIGTRYYVKATATLTCGQETANTTAYAREEETKRGMDGAQITGAASSYARKYALNALLLIDDTKDPDTQDNTKDAVKPEASDKTIAGKRDIIKAKLGELGKTPKTVAEAKSTIKELTGMEFDVKNYELIIQSLTEICQTNNSQTVSE